MLASIAVRYILSILVTTTVVFARRLPDIYWNSTNHIFDISNTNHVIPVRLLDRVNIICPLPSRHRGAHYEYSKLFAVTQYDYENCQLSDDAKLIGVCQNPHQQSSISIVFRDFSPLPGALEFRPGHNYYIIATSDGSVSGSDNREGGLCLQKHMKVKFEVQPDDRLRTIDEYDEPINDQLATNNHRWKQHQQTLSDDAELMLSTSTIMPRRVATTTTTDSGDDQIHNDGYNLRANRPQTTQVMYIIHTKSPDDDAYSAYNQQEAYISDHEEAKKDDDDGGGVSNVSSSCIVIIAGVLAVDLTWRRLFG